MNLFSIFLSALAVGTTTAQIDHKFRDVSMPPEPCAVVSSSSSAFYTANPTRKYPENIFRFFVVAKNCNQ
jgi:hypothetical protein